MKKADEQKLEQLCQAVAKHTVEDEDGDKVSVAFGGNCGVFAYALLNFLDEIDYPYEEWEFGFFFENCKRLSDLEDPDNNCDLNHVVLMIDGKLYDGGGQTTKEEWYGKFFKMDDMDRIVDIISQFTVYSVGDKKLFNLFKKEWAKLEGKPLSEKIDVKQKYPTVPTRDFITILAKPGGTSFTVQAGLNHRRIYQGGTNGDKIVSSYFDGMNAVIVCQKRIFVFGPYNPKQPEKAWRLLHSHNAH